MKHGMKKLAGLASLVAWVPMGMADLLIYEGFDTGVAVDTAAAGAGLLGATSFGFAPGSAWDASETNSGEATFTASGLGLGYKFATTGGALRLKVEESPALAGTGANAYRQSGITVADGETIYGSFLYRPDALNGRFVGGMGVETGYAVKFDGSPLTYGAHRIGANDDPWLFSFLPDSFNSANNNFTGYMQLRRYGSGSFASVDQSTNPLEYARGLTYLGVWKITNMSGYPTNPDNTTADPTLTAQDAVFWILTKDDFEAIYEGGITEAELDANNLGKLTLTQASFRAHLVASDFINIMGLSGGATGGQAGTFDEIRIGTTLDAVLPVKPAVPQGLLMSKNGSSFDLQWPGAWAGMVLQQSDTLEVPGNWTAYPEAPLYNGGLAQLSVPSTAWSGRVFFRLNEPAPANPFSLFYNEGNATVAAGFWSSIDNGNRVVTDGTTGFVGSTALLAVSDQTKPDRFFNPSIPAEEPDRWHSEAKLANIAVEGDTRWAGLAVKFDGTTRNASRTFAQWMDVVGFYPSVMFTIAPAFGSPANNDPATIWRLNMKIIRAVGDEVVVDLLYGTVAEMYDAWHRIVVKTYFTSGNDGYIQVWHAFPGGQYQLVDLDNGATYRGLTFRNESGSGVNTFTTGCYAFWSGDASGSDVVQNWVDEVRVADNASSFEDVAP